jgi:hypothetical protein
MRKGREQYSWRSESAADDVALSGVNGCSREGCGRMKLVVWLWKVVSWFLPREKVPVPGNVLVLRELPEGDMLNGLVQAFQTVYSAPPWNEDWSPVRVGNKLRQELREGVLVLLLEGPCEVVGFAWGAVIPPVAIIPRIVASFPQETEEPSEGLKDLISRFREKLLYWDEIALLSKAQRGLEPLRWLTLPVLQFAQEQGVKSVLFRTTPGSKVVGLTRFLGFRRVFARKIGDLEEIYLYLEDLRPFLKITEFADSRKVAAVMKLLSQKRRFRAWPTSCVVSRVPLCPD